MILRFTRTALKQIETAIGYVEDRAPAGAEAIRSRLRDVTIVLRDHPLAGQATTRPGIRRLVITPHPYAVFYRVTPDEVIVTRFRHTSRRPVAGSA